MALALTLGAALAGWTVTSGERGGVLALLLVCQFVIAGIGLADDILSLPSLVRLAVHVLVAGGLVVLAPLGLPESGDWSGGALAAAGALSAIWLVGLTNAYNFMDGIDGIAGTQGVVAGLGWALLGRMAGEPGLAMLGLVLASACLGFLVLNWPPARVFMGDVGSGLLGFTFAAMTLIGGRRAPILAICGLLLVWPFVLDTAFTLVRRLIRRENVLRAHRSHVYQRLVIAGLNHRQVTLLYGSLALAGLIGAVLLAARIAWAALFVVMSISALAGGVYAWLRRLETISERAAETGR